MRPFQAAHHGDAACQSELETSAPPPDFTGATFESLILVIPGSKRVP
jgi:hypothetical protein